MRTFSLEQDFSTPDVARNEKKRSVVKTPNSQFIIPNWLCYPDPRRVIFAQILFELSGSPFRELEGRAAIPNS